MGLGDIRGEISLLKLIMNMETPSALKRLHIATMGCQMNVYDSGRLAGLLAAEGYVQVDDPAQADLILLNTCSVRHRAEHKVYSQLGELREIKQARPQVIIGVGGCVGQQEGGRLLKRVPHLDLVFGPGALEQVPELVRDAARGKRRVLTPKSHPPAKPAPLELGAPGLKALVTVMEGCDNFCSYCVVPYVRGREQSRPAAWVLEEINRLVEAGVREVTLLGQNVNSYRDPDSGLDFAGLLEKAAEVPGLWRIRFATSHPKDLSPRLMEAMAGLPQVMEQLHLPVQSGSDRILKAMRRGYTAQRYLELVEKLRAMAPGLALGGDMIVGFPGESEDDFAKSLGLLRAVRYDYLYSFNYSDRPHTRASRLADKIPDKVKARRLAELQGLQREISLEIHQSLVGKIEQVLVEGPAKKGEGLLTGRSRAGRAVNFSGSPALAGSLAWVRITEGRVNSLMGRLETPAEGG